MYCMYVSSYAEYQIAIFVYVIRYLCVCYYAYTVLLERYPKKKVLTNITSCAHATDIRWVIVNLLSLVSVLECYRGK